MNRARARDLPAAYLAIAVLSVVIAGFALMIPLGLWKNDEYWILGATRRIGLRYLRWGLLWSPRPLWHGLFFVYGRVVAAVARPLIGPTLLTLWLTVPIAWWLALGALRRRAWAWVLFLSLFAAALTGTRVIEMFYWIAAALAYVPSFAALLAILAVLALRGSRDSRDRRMLLVAGLVASLSSEFGQMVAISFAMFGAAVLIVRREKPGAWLLIPACVGVLLVPLMLFFRLGRAELTLAGSTTLGRPWTSLIVGFGQSVANLWPLAAPDTPHGVSAFGVAVMVLLMLGALAFWRALDAQPDRGMLLAYAAALLFTCWAVSVLALYHFGWSCCERHITMQHAAACVALTAIAATFAARVAVPPALGAGAVLAAVLMPAVLWLPFYRGAVSTWREDARAKQETWASGTAPGHGDMTLTYCRACTVFQYDAYAVPGRWTLGRETPWAQRSVMDFFDKSALVQRAVD